MAKLNLFDAAQKQLDECAKILKLDSDIHAILRVPAQELHVSLPIRMDDGSIKMFQGLKV
jgi:glutamate dehydrogenase (NAD(P)+)